MEFTKKIVIKTMRFENIFIAFDNIVNSMDKVQSLNYIMSQVHPDSTVRAAGKAGSDSLDPLWTDMYSDKAIYQQITKFRNSQ